jgi:hypothetical protein
MRVPRDGILLREKGIYSFDFIPMTTSLDVHPITKGHSVLGEFSLNRTKLSE